MELLPRAIGAVEVAQTVQDAAYVHMPWVTRDRMSWREWCEKTPLLIGKVGGIQTKRAHVSEFEDCVLLPLRLSLVVQFPNSSST